MEEKKIDEKKYLINWDMVFVICCSIFAIGVLFWSMQTDNSINTLIENANTNSLNDELNIKYLIGNDQVIAEELLDQKQRIENIEVYLGISEGGLYDTTE